MSIKFFCGKNCYIKHSNVRISSRYISIRKVLPRQSDMPRVSLDLEFPMSKPSVKSKAPKQISTEPLVSRLKNGMYVATRDSISPIATIGLMVKAGSKYESLDFYGQSSFLEKMAFKASEQTSSFSITQQIERMGGQINFTSTRENIFYSVDVIRKFSSSILDMMSDCLLNPAFNTFEINNAKFEYAESLENVTSDELIEEDVHRTAFGMKGIGLPHRASREMLDKINKQTLAALHSRLFSPPRMSLAAVGVDHVEFVAMAKQFFGGFKASDLEKASSAEPPKDVYVGGEIRRIDDDTKKDTFFVVAFASPGGHSEDIPALCVLGTLLGGGNSFSIGGPGKGMHSRLYTNVLNGMANVNSCNVIGHINEDAGVFGISGSTDYENAKKLSLAIIHEAKSLTSADQLTDEMFARAKNSALSAFLMNLENNRSLVEDYAKQLLLYGKIYTVEDLKAKLEAVQKKDVLRIAREMLKTKPSVVVRGNTLDVPSYEHILEMLPSSFGKQLSSTKV